MANFINSKNELLVTGLTVLVVAVVFFGFVYPQLCDVNENFAAEMEERIGMAGDEREDENVELNESKRYVASGPGYVAPGWPEPRKPLDKIPENYYFLDDGAGGRMSIQHNLCSKSCCSEQYPTPFKMKHDPYVCNNKDKFVPSNIYCNNSFQDSGCLCLTKDQSEYMYNRGGNGREWF
ncbi:MAG: hypothetical protein CMF62_00415 [Magnetococcales bacterium]|nr:hypothetical protein [Magnetococcales bacterium]|tara:strand:- start:3029 stop:3565 length:537 start_codon:yes stop_codon:yes gene_type:complete